MTESSGKGSTVGSSPEEMGGRHLLELEIAEGCETPSACWDSNLGSLQEQQVFLTTEPFLQPKSLSFRFETEWYYVALNGPELTEEVLSFPSAGFKGKQ